MREKESEHWGREKDWEGDCLAGFVSSYLIRSNVRDEEISGEWSKAADSDQF